MHKFYTAFLFLIVFPVLLHSQTPQGLSYQFVVRNSSGQVLSEEEIGTRISILHGSATGNAVYSELHTITTNINGAGSLEIGSGESQNGSFGSINWSQGPYFLMTETDPEGGTDYSIVGVSQMLSVPYALHAANGFYHQIGDLAKGGIIFSLWKDSDGVEHGLVASTSDQGENIPWGELYMQTASNSASNGSLNSGALEAGDLCTSFTGTNSSGEVYDDWYLPAVWELNELHSKAFIINAVLDSDGDETTYGFPSNLNSSYWSSTELGGAFAWFVEFASGMSNTNWKDANYRVRAIRRF